MTRNRDQLDKIGDGRLVQQIEEALSTKRALEIELTAMLDEYGRRRVRLARAGKKPSGALAEPLAIDDHTRTSIARREQLAADHYEADQAAQRDPRTRTMLAS
jgi:hypothetical protein